jgi:hypothetical protein
MTVALTGYETVTVLQSDFNDSRPSLFDRFRFGGRSKQGNLCHPFESNVGNTFTTNYSLFEWELVTVAKLNDSSRSLIYRGSTLETCDVVALYLDAQMQIRSADLTALITCHNLDGFTLLAKTSFSVTLLSGKYSPPLLGATPEIFGLRTNMSTNGRLTAVVLNRMSVLCSVLIQPH